MPVILADKYELGRTLGQGASCKVKLARDAQGKRYAIKIMNNAAEFDECIESELQILQRLSHRNIVQLVEVGQGLKVNPRKGQRMVKFVVLELVGGGELFDFVALGGRLTEPQARNIFGQLLDGLDYMHQKGYAHRDLKPENLLINKDHVLKITDFGFATKLSGRDGQGLLYT